MKVGRGVGMRRSNKLPRRSGGSPLEEGEIYSQCGFTPFSWGSITVHKSKGKYWGGNGLINVKLEITNNAVSIFNTALTDGNLVAILTVKQPFGQDNAVAYHYNSFYQSKTYIKFLNIQSPQQNLYLFKNSHPDIFDVILSHLGFISDEQLIQSLTVFYNSQGEKTAKDIESIVKSYKNKLVELHNDLTKIYSASIFNVKEDNLYLKSDEDIVRAKAAAVKQVRSRNVSKYTVGERVEDFGRGRICGMVIRKTSEDGSGEGPGVVFVKVDSGDSALLRRKQQLCRDRQQQDGKDPIPPHVAPPRLQRQNNPVASDGNEEEVDAAGVASVEAGNQSQLMDAASAKETIPAMEPDGNSTIELEARLARLGTMEDLQKAAKEATNEALDSAMGKLSNASRASAASSARLHSASTAAPDTVRGSQHSRPLFNSNNSKNDLTDEDEEANISHPTRDSSIAGTPQKKYTYNNVISLLKKKLPTKTEYKGTESFPAELKVKIENIYRYLILQYIEKEFGQIVRDAFSDVLQRGLKRQEKNKQVDEMKNTVLLESSLLTDLNDTIEQAIFNKRHQISNSCLDEDGNVIEMLHPFLFEDGISYNESDAKQIVIDEWYRDVLTIDVLQPDYFTSPSQGGNIYRGRLRQVVRRHSRRRNHRGHKKIGGMTAVEKRKAFGQLMNWLSRILMGGDDGSGSSSSSSSSLGSSSGSGSGTAPATPAPAPTPAPVYENITELRKRIRNSQNDHYKVPVNLHVTLSSGDSPIHVGDAILTYIDPSDLSIQGYILLSSFTPESSPPPFFTFLPNQTIVLQDGTRSNTFHMSSLNISNATFVKLNTITQKPVGNPQDVKELRINISSIASPEQNIGFEHIRYVSTNEAAGSNEVVVSPQPADMFDYSTISEIIQQAQSIGIKPYLVLPVGGKKRRTRKGRKQRRPRTKGGKPNQRPTSTTGRKRRNRRRTTTPSASTRRRTLRRRTTPTTTRRRPTSLLRRPTRK